MSLLPISWSGDKALGNSHWLSRILLDSPSAQHCLKDTAIGSASKSLLHLFLLLVPYLGRRFLSLFIAHMVWLDSSITSGLIPPHHTFLFTLCLHYTVFQSWHQYILLHLACWKQKPCICVTRARTLMNRIYRLFLNVYGMNKWQNGHFVTMLSSQSELLSEDLLSWSSF